MTLLLWLSTVTLAALLVALLGERRQLHRSLRALHRKLGAGNAESPSSTIAAIGRAIGELQTARRGDEAGLTRLHHVLDGLDTSILVFDRAGDIRLANAGGQRLTAGHHGDALVLTAARELAEAFREGEEDRKVACLELGGPPRQVFEITARAAASGRRTRRGRSGRSSCGRLPRTKRAVDASGASCRRSSSAMTRATCGR